MMGQKGALWLTCMGCGCVCLLCIQVLPGGRIPADGSLVVGSSYINEAMITGESQPVMKQRGDALIGGTINTGEDSRVLAWQSGVCQQGGGCFARTTHICC